MFVKLQLDRTGLKFNIDILIITICILLFYSCEEQQVNTNAHLNLSDYDNSQTMLYRVDAEKIRESIDILIKSDKDSLAIDRRVKKYYSAHGRFLWIDRLGVDERADTFLTYLEEVKNIGFNPEKFRIAQIKADLKRVRTLDFDFDGKAVNKVFARLEYNLTKAYLRYTVGQRFGYMNPHYIFNRLDVKEKDSLHISYYELFGLDIEKPSVAFYHEALRKIGTDSLQVFLKEIQPQQSIYKKMLNAYVNGNFPRSQHVRLLCNLERSRWRQSDYPDNYQKYVWVNIPSLHLDAIDGDSILSMRMVCGTLKTKTPLLTSRITRMDINPQWVIPQSIVKRDILPQLGNWGYFAKKRYFVRSRKTGERINLHSVTYDMINSGRYAIVQEGGEGNALGRIVFRFANNFSVFIHDTSSRHVFNSSDRSASHGCIRVEKPYELALFMLSDKDEKMAEKIKYSMSVNLHHNGHEGEVLDKNKFIRSHRITPVVPLFINYYTIYPNAFGGFDQFNDIYGYDAVIYNHLRNYM